MGCPFCDIVLRNAPAMFVKQWNDTIAIAPLDPVTPGHLLVIPHIHVKNALERPEVTAVTMARACELASELRLHEASWNIITSVGELATQTVEHLHIHLVPRRPNDGLVLPWTPSKSAG